jgi:hypothetical protein
MYIHVDVCISIYIYIYIYTYCSSRGICDYTEGKNIYVYKVLMLHEYIFINPLLLMLHKYMYLYIYIYIYTYLCMCRHIYIHVYVYIYIGLCGCFVGFFCAMYISFMIHLFLIIIDVFCRKQWHYVGAFLKYAFG